MDEWFFSHISSFHKLSFFFRSFFLFLSHTFFFLNFPSLSALEMIFTLSPSATFPSARRRRQLWNKRDEETMPSSARKHSELTKIHQQFFCASARVSVLLLCPDCCIYTAVIYVNDREIYYFELIMAPAENFSLSFFPFCSFLSCFAISFFAVFSVCGSSDAFLSLHSLYVELCARLHTIVK